jgi:urease accessory protein UreF
MTFTSGDDPSAQLEAIEDAIDVLEAGGTISSGVANSLSAKLGAAMHQVDHQPHAAANMLTAFIHQVTALVRTGRLSVADGTNLITAAQNLIDDLAN